MGTDWLGSPDGGARYRHVRTDSPEEILRREARERVYVAALEALLKGARKVKTFLSSTLRIDKGH